MKDVFISYSEKDQEAKEELIKLFDKEDITYFIDENDLELGKDIQESLKENLRETRFTVLIVSRNSLLSTSIGMETMFRLQQENFYKKNTLICVVIDKSILELQFPLEMQKHFNERRKELETLRKEIIEADGKSKIYDLEIHRIDDINVGEVMIKVRNYLGAVLDDENRREKDLMKLLQTIKSQELPESIKYNIISDQNVWIESLFLELKEVGIPLRKNKATEIFKCYGWMIEAFLQKMKAKLREENPLRRLSFMAEAYHASLRYLSYIQLSQIIKLDKKDNNKNPFISDFLQLQANYNTFNFLEILETSTEILSNQVAFVPEINNLVQRMNDSEEELFGVTLFLENNRNKLIRGEVSSQDENFEEISDEYLTALIYWLRQIAFIAKYRLISIKNIELNYLLGFEKSFSHLYGELHGIYAQDIDEAEYSTIALDDFTYSQSILLLKGSNVEVGFDKIEEGDYLSLSPLLIDQSVYDGSAQTPEIYYFKGHDKKMKSYQFAHYKNEMPLNPKEEKNSNKYQEVKAQNNRLAKLNELYKQLDKLLKPLII